MSLSRPFSSYDDALNFLSCALREVQPAARRFLAFEALRVVMAPRGMAGNHFVAGAEMVRADVLPEAEVAGLFRAAALSLEQQVHLQQDYLNHCTGRAELGLQAMRHEEFRELWLAEMARVGGPDGITQDHEQRGDTVSPGEARERAVRS